MPAQSRQPVDEVGSGRNPDDLRQLLDHSATAGTLDAEQRDHLATALELHTQPAGHQIGNSAGRIGWKIDTRGHGGYVVAAGSTIAGHRYRTTTHMPPQELPDWITTALHRTSEQTTQTGPGRDLKDSSAYVFAALTGELQKVLAATEGNRNHTLNHAAFALGQLVGDQLLDEATARDELVSAAGRIGLPRTEAERTINSGFTAGTRQPRH